jgi:photosystem II stability/assembly factor-like uncharacterized protein
MKKSLFILFFNFIFFSSGHSQWIPINTDTTYSLNCVYFLNKDTGYVVGEIYPKGICLRTEDGGITWDTTYTTNTTFHMIVNAPTDSVAYFGGEDGDVNKTTDAGQTWTQLLSVHSLVDCSDYNFLSKDTGFAVDFYGQVYKTTDGAGTWQMVHQTNYNFLHNYFPGTGKFQFLNHSLGFLADGDSGLVLKTMDGGNTWTNINVGNVTMNACSIYMLNPDTGFVVGTKGKICKTINGGTTWSAPIQIASTNDDLFDVTFFTNQIGYIVGGTNPNGPPNNQHGIIMVTYDGGTTWFRDDSLCCGALTAICKGDDSTGYAVGWAGKVLKISNPGYAAGINSNSNNDFSVSIFPNPFSSSATISITGSENANEKMQFELYDVFGRKVRSVEIHKAIFSIEKDNLSNGIYLWKIVAENESVRSGKIIVE